MNVQENKIPYGFCLLSLSWLAFMFLVVPVDYEWTLVLREHRIRALYKFMGQTIFEGEGLGGGDPVIFLILFAAGAYYLAWKFGASSRFYAWRPHLGFILTSALTCSVMMVHSLKWVMGRARPGLVVKDQLPFTDWYVFGPHFITEGTYRGSFPSGHTAQAFVLVSIAYVLVGAVSQNKTSRLTGWAWGGLSVCYVVLMGVSRCMSLSHWLSDVMGAFGLSWILMHTIYFHVLKVPEQIDYYRRFAKNPNTPKAWELRLCFHLLGMVLGGVSVMLAIRGAILGAPQGFYLLILAGIPFILFFYRRFQNLYRRSMNGILRGNQER